MNPLSKEFQTRRANRTDRPSKTKDCARSHDSGAERDMSAKLEEMKAAGLIDNIRHHPPSLKLLGDFKWNIDFIVFEHKRQCDIAIDAKAGHQDNKFVATLQLWPSLGPMPLQIWGKIKGRMKLIKEIRGKK